LDAIKSEDWELLPELVDIPAAVNAYADGHVVVNEFGEVTYDGELVHNTVAKRITEFFREELPFMPLVRFLENLMANPSRRAVDELYNFLENEGMPITEDGCFVGYKGVQDNFLDVHSGTFDNSPGEVISMPRREVDDDARKSCSYGFHVGSQRYAKNWGEKVVLVKVNPADAVSVPYDSAEKLRVCKYEVIAISEGLLQDKLYQEPALDDEYGCEDEEEYLPF
jgi:hypothetical protein